MGMNPNKMHSIPFKKYISKKKGTNNDKDKINDEKDKQQIDEKIAEKNEPNENNGVIPPENVDKIEENQNKNGAN